MDSISAPARASRARRHLAGSPPSSPGVSTSSKQRTYQSPQLTVYGSLMELTAAPGGNVGRDGIFGSRVKT